MNIIQKHVIKRKLVVKNAMGLHARPATMIVKVLQNVKSDVTFAIGDKKTNGKSLMGILLLAASQGTEIEVTVSGEDAQGVMEHLVKVFQNNFGE